MYLPRFTITNKLLMFISRADSARSAIEQSPLIPIFEKKFQEDARIRTAHHTTHIEGNNLDEAETRKILSGFSANIASEQSQIQEVLNYRNVLKYISNYQKSNQLPTNSLLTIHRLAMDKILPSSELGKYRKINVVVKDSQKGGVTFTPPEPKQVPNLTELFFNWLNENETQKIHTALVAGITHYEIAAIHPFVDGNGRTARAMTLLLLYQRNYDVKRLFSLDEYYDKDTLIYYQALSSVQKNNQDLTQWLEYFSQGLAEEFESIQKRTAKMSQDARLKKRVGQIMLNERQEQIILYVEEHRYIKNKDWQIIFPKVSDDTILRDVKDLLDKKVLIKKGKTKSAWYEMRP